MPMCLEPIDEVRKTAYTIELFNDEDGKPRGRVLAPTHGSARQPQRISSNFSPAQAIEIAIRLARQVRAEVIVWDPEGLWPADSGKLFRG